MVFTLEMILVIKYGKAFQRRINLMVDNNNPDSREYKIGFPIKIGKIDSIDCQIFDSGTCLSKNWELLTDGGRVLSIVCQDIDFDMVFKKAYKNLKEINFDGIYFRNDIGHQVRKNFSKEN